MIIRPAFPSDADQIAKLINMAMLEITYQFIRKEDEDEANNFIASLVRQPNNQYSYQNIFVIQELDNIIGQICIYDGERIEELRSPVWQKIQDEYGHTYEADNETSGGEMYIDTFAIVAAARGKGLGIKLLNFVIDHYVHKQGKTLGLLVEKSNPNAKRLYEKIGFKVVNDITIFEKEMEHMQYA